MKKTIEKIVNYAVWVAEPEKIILFGSMASGKNTVDSDLDLLIIVKKAFRKNQISQEIKQFAQELSLEADVLVCSGEDLETALETPTSFLTGIFKSGRIVYQKEQKSL